MNKARISGIIIFILGFYLMYVIDKYESGFLLGMLTGIITAIGFGLIVFGKFKFWEKSK